MLIIEKDIIAYSGFTPKIRKGIKNPSGCIIFSA
jgi:hypothetical protein